MKRLRPIRGDARLSVVDHLDELRSRVIVSIAAFAVALGLCFWENHLILRLVNRPLHGRRPITLGPAEPFTTTFRLAAYAAIVLTLPVLLYQAYAFVLPALTSRERRVATPLILMVPALFIAGVAFGYLLVLPAALKFLLHFNSHEFDVQIRWRRYAIVACAVVAMLLPGVDPVRMVLEMLPLVALYELSIVLAAAFGRPRATADLPALSA